MIWHPLDGFNGLYLYALVSICTRVVCHCVGTCIILIECHLTSNLSLKPRQPFNSSSQAQPTSRLSPFMWLWHVSRTCVASQSHMRDVRMTNDAHSQMWHVYLGQMHSYVWHVSFKCGGVIRSYVWICVRMCAKSERSKIQVDGWHNVYSYKWAYSYMYRCIPDQRSKSIYRNMCLFRNRHNDILI